MVVWVVYSRSGLTYVTKRSISVRPAHVSPPIAVIWVFQTTDFIIRLIAEVESSGLIFLEVIWVIKFKLSLNKIKMSASILLTTVAEVETTTLSLEDKFNILIENVNGFFLIVMGIFVFLMQAGFAFLEAGSVR